VDETKENEIAKLVEEYFSRQDVKLHVEPCGKVQVIKNGRVIGERG